MTTPTREHAREHAREYAREHARRWLCAALIIGAGYLLAQPAQVQAQAPMGGAMPDLRTMAGKPLPMADMRPGTVIVRVARKMPVNAVAGALVSATVAHPSGEARKKVAKTGDDGRATFEGLDVGSEFKGEVTVDGERLQTTAFTIPAQGGTRVMLIAGLGAPPAGENAAPEATGGPPGGEAGEDAFARAAVTGTVQLDDTLPKGAIDIAIVLPQGQPPVGREVKLGEVGPDKNIKVHSALTDKNGVAHFTGMPIGDAAGYAAIVDHEGLRLATDVFRLPADKGVRGTIRALERTTDMQTLRIDNRSVVVIEAREDALAVMQSLLFRNTSEKIFDAGQGGFVLPLPEGFVSAQEISGGVPIEVRAREGIAIRTTIAPASAAGVATQVRFGFILLANGEAVINYKQPLPAGMESPLIVLPANSGLTLQGPGLRKMADAQDNGGGRVLRYETDGIAPGGALSFTISGLPVRDTSSRTVAGTLATLLIAGALAFARAPKQQAANAAKAKQELIDRRERLFGELVAQEARARDSATGPNEAATQRRRELVSKLEIVYRDLAALDRPEDGPA